jgi:acetylornithine deacetylase/succinyl-diaminopimelate desuccinylase-like protein
VSIISILWAAGDGTPVLAQPASSIDSALHARVVATRDAIASDLVRLGTVISPSGQEHRRAELVAASMRQLGLRDVRLDSVPNVVGRIRGSAPDAARRAVVFVATLDDLAPVAEHQRRAAGPPRIVGDRVVGPGTHTSSTTAAMLGAIRALRGVGYTPEYDLVFAAVAQEETGLVGMKQLYAEWKDRATAFVDILGDGRSINYGAIGIHWYQVWAYAPGGHSLTGGLPNVNQGVARAVDRLLAIPQPPPASRTVLNVAMIRSGDVFNRKPDSAWFSLDLRSLDAASIARNESAVRAVLDTVARETGTRFVLRPTQQTRGGQITGADTSRLVRTSVAIARALGIEPRLGNAGSSNLNVPIAGGTLAIGLGGERGGMRAEPGEFADIAAMLRTAEHVARLAAAMGRAPSP